MGWFVDLVWVDGEWTVSEPHDQLPVAGPGVFRLHVSIYDSDYATVTFRSPSARQTGQFYLGIEPAEYFGDPRAGRPVRHKNAAKAFTRWVRAATARRIDATDVLVVMAKPGVVRGDVVEADVETLLTLATLSLPSGGPWG